MIKPSAIAPPPAPPITAPMPAPIGIAAIPPVNTTAAIIAAAPRTISAIAVIARAVALSLLLSGIRSMRGVVE